MYATAPKILLSNRYINTTYRRYPMTIFALFISSAYIIDIFCNHYSTLNKVTMKGFPVVTALLGVVSGHTIMQAIGGYSQGVGIYMPSDDSVRAVHRDKSYDS